MTFIDHCAFARQRCHICATLYIIGHLVSINIYPEIILQRNCAYIVATQIMLKSYLCTCILYLNNMSRTLYLSIAYLTRYHPAVEKMKSVLAEYGRPVVGLSAVYQCAYSTLDRPLWWNMDTSGGLSPSTSVAQGT